MKNVIEGIYWRNDHSHLGLDILLDLGVRFLYFHSGIFYYLSADNVRINSEWIKFEYECGDVHVDTIYEYEFTRYYVTLSNRDIIYIKEIISNIDGEWEQDFDIVSSADDNYEQILNDSKEPYLEIVIPQMIEIRIGD